MKKIILILLVCSLLCICVAASSCDSPSETPNNGADTSDGTVPETETKPESESTEPENGDSDMSTYTVTVTDTDGNPIAGVVAQICVGDTCYFPNATNENGVVVFSNMKVEAGSAVQLKIIGEDSTEGYVYPSEKIDINEGQTEISVTVEKTAD